MSNSLVAVVSRGIHGVSLGHAAQVAAKGAPCAVVDSMRSLAPSDRLRCLVVDQDHVQAALDALPGFPAAKIVVLCDGLTPALLAAALREPRIVGFTADGYDGPQLWEVAYIVRRAVYNPPPAPIGELFHWAQATVSFTARDGAERDRVVEAVATVAARFGLSKPLSRQASEAARHLLDNAMGHAPIAPDGSPLYRGAHLTLPDEHAPQLQLLVDAERIGIEVTDPFGSLERARLYSTMLRAHTDPPNGRASSGFVQLHETASLFRIASTPGAMTRASFVLQRNASRRDFASLYWESEA